jgi:hypothetical protein
MVKVNSVSSQGEDWQMHFLKVPTWIKMVNSILMNGLRPIKVLIQVLLLTKLKPFTKNLIRVVRVSKKLILSLQ